VSPFALTSDCVQYWVSQSPLHQLVVPNLDDDARIKPNDTALTPSALAWGIRQHADALA
jgi:hypothetical protein